MDFLNAPVIIGLLQLGGGWLVKRYKKEIASAIPIANYILALIGFSLVPAEANAGLWGALTGGGNVFVQALLQTVAVTGIHSTGKNSFKPLILNLLTQLYAKKSG